MYVLSSVQYCLDARYNGNVLGILSHVHIDSHTQSNEC